jgi:peptidoglycan/LPS O-acetylase OafA/YrhL
MPASRLRPDLSVCLDLIRVALSLTVAIGHWTQGYFQDGWPDLTRLAAIAVGGFFVLSGFMIRALYPSGQAFSLTKYLIERLSRIFSVTVPALILTVLLDSISYHASPAYYVANWQSSLDHAPARVVINLIGLSQIWSYDIAPLSNGPFWSISYELAFYLIYGLWCSGRPAAAALTLLVFGPETAVLLCVWLLGAAAFDASLAPKAVHDAARRILPPPGSASWCGHRVPGSRCVLRSAYSSRIHLTYGPSS